MSEIFNPVGSLPVVQSLSLPVTTFYTGRNNPIIYVKAETDQGPIMLHNRSTLGLKVIPDHFESAGTTTVKLLYRDGVRPAVTAEVEVNVIPEAPTKLILLNSLKETSFKKDQKIYTEYLRFKVLFNSGACIVITGREVRTRLEGSKLVFTYGEGIYSSTCKLEVNVSLIEISSIQASASKTSYEAGETVNKNAFRVEALYTDGSKKALDDFEIAPAVVKAGDNFIRVSLKDNPSIYQDVAITVNTVLKTQEDLEAKLLRDSKDRFILSGNIKLGADVTTSTPFIVSDDDTSIDLSNHTLSTPSLALAKNIEIKNGRIKTVEVAKSSLMITYGELSGEGVHKISLENVTLESALSKQAAGVIQTDEWPVEVSLKNCVINSANPETYLIGSFGENVVVELENVSLNCMIGTNNLYPNATYSLKNVKCAGGMYFAASGIYSIDGGEYSSINGSALEVKSGNVSILSGTFKATGEHKHVPNNSGASTEGYDIVAVTNSKYNGGKIIINPGVIGLASELVDSKNSNNMLIEDRRANTAKSIEVLTEPTNRDYELSKKNIFDATGMTFKVTKSDNSVEEVSALDSRIVINAPEFFTSTTLILIAYKDAYSYLSYSYKAVVESMPESVVGKEVEAIPEKETTLTAGKTKVSIPANTLTESTTLKAQASVGEVSTVARADIEADGSKSNVTAIDLAVLGADGNRLSFFQNAIEVIVPIEKGLASEDVACIYLSETDDAEWISDVSYDSSTGLATFKTSHLSTFYLGKKKNLNNLALRNSAIALDVTHGVYLETFAKAFEDVTEDFKVKLLKDSITQEAQLIKIYPHHLTLDLNGHTIAAPSTPLDIRGGRVDIIGAGKITESEADQFAALYILGSDKASDENYTVVNVGPDVVLSGWAGIFVDGPNPKKDRPYMGYGVVVNSEAQILVPIDEDKVSGGTGAYINGSNKITEGPVPSITLKGTIKSRGPEGCGIYAAGYGVWNIEDATLSAQSSALEVRAGKVIARNSSFEATAPEYKVTPQGSAATTEGAAIAIAQHTTKLPIDVTLENASVKAQVGICVVNPQKNDAAACAKVSVSGIGIQYATVAENIDVAEDFTLTGTVENFEIAAAKASE